MELDHVQIAVPHGSESAARSFYGTLLGLAEIEKPEPLKSRGGVWFSVGELQLHLGVDVPHRPAQKAHPAFRTSKLETIAARLETAGHQVQWDNNLPGFSRFYVHDPFGNRLEFLTPVSEPVS